LQRIGQGPRHYDVQAPNKNSTHNSRLIAVSNRTAIDPNARAGGLAVALWDSLKESRGLWIGWSGKIKDYASQKATLASDDGVEFALCDLTKSQYEGFYLQNKSNLRCSIHHAYFHNYCYEGNSFYMAHLHQCANIPVFH